MAKDRYVIMARWWNGHGFDVTKKTVATKKEALGAVKLLIEQVRPWQISITDLKNAPWEEPHPPGGGDHGR